MPGDRHAHGQMAQVDHQHGDHVDTPPFIKRGSVNVETYRLTACEPTQILNEGDVLDLGDRALEVLHLPGHSPVRIALYDPKTQELFSGDVIYDGELLDTLHCSHIPTYLATYDRLARLPVETVYPGHYRIFGKDDYWQIVDDYRRSRRSPSCPSEVGKPQNDRA